MRKLRLEKLQKREIREEAKLKAQLLGASASMISFQSLREKVRKDKNERTGEKLRRVELFKRNQRYVKRRLKVLRNKQKKEKKMLIARDRRTVNKLLKKNKRKEEKRLLVARSNLYVRANIKSSYELLMSSIQKMELRSTKSLFQNVVCVGELIRTGKKCKLLLPLYVLMVLSYSHLTKQLLIWKIQPKIR